MIILLPQIKQNVYRGNRIRFAFDLLVIVIVKYEDAETNYGNKEYWEDHDRIIKSKGRCGKHKWENEKPDWDG